MCDWSHLLTGLKVAGMAMLTDKILKTIEPPDKGRKLVFDSHRDAPKGFGVRVSPKGRRTYVLRYKADGKDRLMNIGDYPTWTLTAARRKANELRQQVDGGVDILQQRRARRAEGTVGAVVEAWCSAHADKLRSGYSIRSTLNLHLVPVLGETKITKLTRHDVITVVEKLAQRAPRQAGLLLTYTKQMLAWCEDREIIQYNPIASLKAKRVASGMAARVRSRVLTDGEIRALWTADNIPGMDRATLLALKFILITGQRPGEVRQATTSEVIGNVWTIPKAHRGKTGDDHHVPLTESALELIAQAQGTEHLFETGSKAMDVCSLSHAVRLCAGALGNDPANPWKPHDLRRTARTGLAAAGVSETVAELTVGHVRKGIAAVYDQYRYEREKRAALEAWERRLLRIVEGGSAKVVSIGQKA